MNLGNRECIMLVAGALVKVYGETLKEDGTDIKMAEEVVKELNDYLHFHPRDMDWDGKWAKDRKILATDRFM